MSDITHHEVESGIIRTIGYDEDKKQLHVDFHGSGKYIYHGVTQKLFDAFLQSDSKGKFLHQHIKGKHGHSR